MRSAQSATTFSLVFPSSVNPAPKPERVSLFPVFVYVFIYLDFVKNQWFSYLIVLVGKPLFVKCPLWAFISLKIVIRERVNNLLVFQDFVPILLLIVHRLELFHAKHVCAS